jgi:hypothetical protein
VLQIDERSRAKVDHASPRRFENTKSAPPCSGSCPTRSRAVCAPRQLTLELRRSGPSGFSGGRTAG